MIYNIKNKIRDISHDNNVAKMVYSQANEYKTKLLANLSDEKFAKIKYKENTGRKLNLDKPTTFNEKLWWLKLNNRNPLLTICSDKVRVREYVKECGLDHILNPIYGIFNDANEINFEKLPDKAFLKTNHGSGTNRLWDRNKSFDKRSFIKEFNKALKNNYYLQSREWNYKNIEPKIIVEKVIEPLTEIGLIDYRFFCFDGEVKMIFIDIETASEDGTHSPHAKRNVYNKKFDYQNIKVSREHFEKNIIEKPKNLNEMIKYAEVLSQPFPFCRVDLYNLDGNIIFGEMTFYPGGATQIIEPEEWELRFGEWIDINSNKIVYE